MQLYMRINARLKVDTKELNKYTNLNFATLWSSSVLLFNPTDTFTLFTSDQQLGATCELEELQCLFKAKL